MNAILIDVYLWGFATVVVATLVLSAIRWRAGTPLMRYQGDHFAPNDVVGLIGIGLCFALVWPYLVLLAGYRLNEWLRK